VDDKLSKPKTKLTEEQLQAGFEELKKYQSTLQEWDALLEDKAATLSDWEDKLLAFTEEHSEEFEDEDDWYESIWEIDDRPVKARKRAMAAKPLDEKAKADVEWLEKLYKLPDRRGKKCT